jgi:7,8-dihydro-6-hydroxymethylpterin-pyrophosphokinase
MYLDTAESFARRGKAMTMQQWADKLDGFLEFNAYEVLRDFGRVRRERWGPRTLDLDILFYGDSIVKTPTLEIPHPRLRERAFVLVPLAEIAADWVDPITHETVQALLEKTVDNSDIDPYYLVLKYEEEFL